MSDYVEIVPGLVIDTEGEIVESAGIDDAVKFLVIQRHEARSQEKVWETRKQDLDRVILRKQAEKRVAYGDIVCDVKGGTYSTVDAGAFADRISDTEFDEADLLAIIAAAKGFDQDKVPEAYREMLGAATSVHSKRPWIETSIARKRAPERKAPDGDLLEKLEDSL